MGNEPADGSLSLLSFHLCLSLYNATFQKSKYFLFLSIEAPIDLVFSEDSPFPIGAGLLPHSHKEEWSKESPYRDTDPICED